MRLNFLTLPAEERHLYIEEAAVRRNVSPVLLEKDFWVCWLLGLLFGSEFARSLVFKGGTSLSKVFGIIERFSEDIDLSLSPEFLKLPEAGTSRNQANKWMTRAEAACAQAVKTKIAPALEAAAEAVIGKRDGGWFEFLTDAHTNSPVLLFHYPPSQPAGFEYLKRAVKLEFGSLTDQLMNDNYNARRVASSRNVTKSRFHAAALFSLLGRYRLPSDMFRIVVDTCFLGCAIVVRSGSCERERLQQP
jgi:hypothetical protein